MIPVLSSEAIKAADAYTIAHEPISSVGLMQRAVNALLPSFLNSGFESFHFVCGTGNNGGDGLALALLLHSYGKTCRISVVPTGSCESPDFLFFKNEVLSIMPQSLTCYQQVASIPHGNEDVYVDAVLGSGFKPPLKSQLMGLSVFFENAGKTVWSIDMPSGLDDKGSVGMSDFVRANKVWALEAPRPALLFPHYKIDFSIVPIGLDPTYMRSITAESYIIEKADVVIAPRKRYAHKGTNGHVLIVGGSTGMTGAPVISAKAAFAAGAGVVTCCVPQVAVSAVQAHLPEAMTRTCGTEYLQGPLPDLSRYDAIVVGPGMGQMPETQEFLLSLLNSFQKPIVIDADALRLVKQAAAFSLLHANCILTPHPGEWAYLSEGWKSEEERIQKARKWVEQYGVHLVLKDTYTTLVMPSAPLFYIQNGNASLATAGSGDMLAGCIAALLAGGMSVAEAVKAGTYYHADSAASFGGKPVRVSQLIDAYHY